MAVLVPVFRPKCGPSGARSSQAWRDSIGALSPGISPALVVTWCDFDVLWSSGLGFGVKRAAPSPQERKFLSGRAFYSLGLWLSRFTASE